MDATSSTLPTSPASPAEVGRSPEPDAPPEALYFRCPPLRATLSLAQCRRNRARPPLLALLLEEEPPEDMQPAACWSCALAPHVEAGAVPFHSAARVWAGCVPRAAREGRPWQPGDPLPGAGVTWPGSA